MKAVSKSVSLPEALWNAVDGRKDDRSSYIRGLVEADLAASGRLPGTPEADARAKFDEALKRHGAAPVLAKIDELADAQLEGAAK